MDGDDIDEIVWDDDLGVTGRNNSYYVYKFVDGQFKLITPVEPGYTRIGSGFSTVNSSAQYGQIKDLDGDGVMEIITAFSDYRDENDKPDYKIYKFNGSEYFLWYEGGYPLPLHLQ